MVFQGRPFFGADILAIGELAAAGDWESGEGTSEQVDIVDAYVDRLVNGFAGRSEEHTSELQSLMRISYAVFCLKKKKSRYSTSICLFVFCSMRYIMYIHMLTTIKRI